MKTKTLYPLVSVLIGIGLTLACGFSTPTPLSPAGKTPDAGGEAGLADLTLYAQVAMDGYGGGCVAAYTPLVTQICVENRGDGAAGAFVVQAEGGQGEWPLDKLGAWETHCFQVDENLGGVALTADSANLIAESDEENNTWRAPVPTPPLICTPAGDAGSATPPPETPTPTPISTATLQPTSTLPPTPTLPPTLAPPAVATQAPLSITSFTLDIVDLPDNGKRVTFNWTTTGAEFVEVYSHVQMRFPIWWSNQPPNGSLTHDFSWTYYPNPTMSIAAQGPNGERVYSSLNADWPCTHPFFFTNTPSNCARAAVSQSAAAEQRFEHGRMIWMQGINLGDQTTGGVIFVFYDTGQYARYNDTWTEGQPESDPTIVPPEGLQQPIRGFGKLWRENANVRGGLGWALSAEVGFTGAWQPESSESLGSYAYVQTVDGQVLRMSGWDSGSWLVWP